MIEPSEDSFETMMELKNPSSKQMESSEGSSNTVEEAPGSSGAQAEAQGGAQAGAQEEAQGGAQAGAQEEAQGGAQAGAQEEAQEGAQAGAQKEAQEGAQEGAQEEPQAEAQGGVQEGAQEEAQGGAQEGAQEGAQAEAQEGAQEEAQEETQEGAQEEAQGGAQEGAQAEAQEGAQEEAQGGAQEGAQAEAQEGAQEEAQGGAQEGAQAEAQEGAQEEAQGGAQEGAQAEAQGGAQEEAQGGAQEGAQASLESGLAQEKMEPPSGPLEEMQEQPTDLPEEPFTRPCEESQNDQPQAMEETSDDSNQESSDGSNHELDNGSNHESSCGSNQESSDVSNMESSDVSNMESSDVSNMESSDVSNLESSYGSHQGESYSSHLESSYSSHQEASYSSHQEASYDSNQEASYESNQESSDNSNRESSDHSHQEASNSSNQEASYESNQEASYESNQESSGNSNQESSDSSTQEASDGSTQEATDGSNHESSDGSNQGSIDGSNRESSYGSNQEESDPLSEISDYSMNETMTSCETQSDQDDTDLGGGEEDDEDSEEEGQSRSSPEEVMAMMASIISMSLRMQDLREQQRVAESIMIQAMNEDRMPALKPFSGDRREYNEFLVLCLMTMQNYPSMVNNDQRKVKFVIRHLSDAALDWANDILEQNSSLINNFSAFLEAMSEKFEYRMMLRVAEDAMFKIRQGDRCVGDYVNEFLSLIPTLGWPDEVLQAHLCQGLNEDIRRYLFRIPQPDSLRNLIVLVLQIEEKLAERRALLRLPPDSRPRSLAWMDAPAPEKWRVSSWQPGELHPDIDRHHFFLMLLLRVNPYHSIAVKALVDTGAEGNYMDERFAQEHYVELYEKPYRQIIQALEGSVLGNQPAWLCTDSLVCVHQKHYELIEFDILPSINFSIILGKKWLETHAPEVDWLKGRCTFHSPYCMKNCSNPPPPCIALERYSMSLLPGLPHIYSDLADVFNPKEADDETSDQPSSDGSDDLSESEPSELQQAGDSDQNGVFYRRRARETLKPVSARMQEKARQQEEYWILYDMLTDRQDYIQMIPELFDQLHGATWFTKLELLEIEEAEMRNSVTHTEDTWRASFGFSLQQMRCYRPYTINSYSDEGDNIVHFILKDILGCFVICHGREVLVYSMSREQHSQHVRQVLVRFRYHNIHCSLDKTQFSRRKAEILGFAVSPKGVKLSKKLLNVIMECPVPETRRCLQGVIELFYPYRHFVEHFSVMAAPLVRQLLSSEPYYWGEEEQEAFDSLKIAFSRMPVLSHPKPQNQFYLDTGIVGSFMYASLIQTDYATGKKTTCAFYSRPLSPMEVEYPQVEMRILPIRAAFMVWCRYLENTEEPIMILLNTEDLASLNNDRLTVLLPGHWVFFFSHFKFNVMEMPDQDDTRALFRRCRNQRGFRAKVLRPLLLMALGAEESDSEDESEGEDEDYDEDEDSEEESEQEELNQQIMVQGLLAAIPMNRILNAFLVDFTVTQIRAVVLNFFRGMFYWRTVLGVAALLVMLRARRPLSPLPAPSLEVVRPQPRPTLRLILDSTLIASSGMATAIAQLLSQMPPLVGANALPAREVAELFLGPTCWHRNALHSQPPRGMRLTPGFWLTLCEFFGVRVNPEEDIFPDPYQHRYLELHVVGDEDVVLREALQDDLQRYRQCGLHDGLQDTSQDAQDNDVQEDLLGDQEAVTFRPRNLLDPEVLDFLNNRLLYTLGPDGRLTLLSRDQVARTLTRFLTMASRMALPSPAREQARLEELSDSDDELD